MNTDKLKYWYKRGFTRQYLSRRIANDFAVCGLKLLEVCRTGVVFRTMRVPQEYVFLAKRENFNKQLRALLERTDRRDTYWEMAVKDIFEEPEYEEMEDYVDFCWKLHGQNV